MTGQQAILPVLAPVQEPLIVIKRVHIQQKVRIVPRDIGDRIAGKDEPPTRIALKRH
jgi:hypothetical protein